MVLRCAVVGSGNIGSDLIAKIQRSPELEAGLLVGIAQLSTALDDMPH